MITAERVMENVRYFNKLYKDGVSREYIRHLIFAFEYANEWGDGFHYCPIIPLDWKKYLNSKILNK